MVSLVISNKLQLEDYSEASQLLEVFLANQLNNSLLLEEYLVEVKINSNLAKVYLVHNSNHNNSSKIKEEVFLVLHQQLEEVVDSLDNNNLNSSNNSNLEDSLVLNSNSNNQAVDFSVLNLNNNNNSLEEDSLELSLPQVVGSLVQVNNRHQQQEEDFLELSQLQVVDSLVHKPVLQHKEVSLELNQQVLQVYSAKQQLHKINLKEEVSSEPNHQLAYLDNHLIHLQILCSELLLNNKLASLV